MLDYVPVSEIVRGMGFCLPFLVLYIIAFVRASKNKSKPWLIYVIAVLSSFMACFGMNAEDSLKYGKGNIPLFSAIVYAGLLAIALVFGLLIYRVIKKGPFNQNKTYNKALVICGSIIAGIIIYTLIAILITQFYQNPELGIENDSVQSTSTESIIETNTVFDSSTHNSELKQGSDGKWGMYYDNGKLNNLYTGLAQNKDTGEWFAVMNGYVVWDYIGVFRNNDTKTWYYCENGTPKYDATGDLMMEDGSILNIENGKVVNGSFPTLDGNHKVSIENGIETIMPK